MIKKIILTAIFWMIVHTNFSQSNSIYKVGDTLYYDNNRIYFGKTNTFVVIRDVGVANNYKVDKYVLNPKTNSFVLECKFTSVGLQELRSNGIYTSYHENGKIKSKGETFNGKKGKETWTFWYENGQKKAEENLNDNNELLKISFWNEKGVQTLKKGNGFCVFVSKDDGYTHKGSYKKGLKNGLWTAFNNGFKVYEEEYKKGKLVKGTSWNAKKEKFTYKKVLTAPFYIKEGNSKIRKYIKHKFNSRDIAAIGSFLITFTVSKTGNVDKVSIDSNGSIECESEFKRIFTGMTGWTPAKKRGQSIESTYSLDIHFN